MIKWLICNISEQTILSQQRFMMLWEWRFLGMARPIVFRKYNFTTIEHCSPYKKRRIDELCVLRVAILLFTDILSKIFKRVTYINLSVDLSGDRLSLMFNQYIGLEPRMLITIICQSKFLCSYQEKKQVLIIMKKDEQELN